MRGATVESLEGLNDGELMLELGKRLRFAERCVCSRCQDWLQHYVGVVFTPLEVDAARKFLNAPKNVQLSALFEDWSTDRIIQELNCDKVENNPA